MYDQLILRSENVLRYGSRPYIAQMFNPSSKGREYTEMLDSEKLVPEFFR